MRNIKEGDGLVKFKKLGIETLEDLLLYFPFRYEDFKTRNVLEL